MFRKKQFFLKNVLPLLLAFLAAFVFFFNYNNYLLDKTLANLRVSLKKLESSDESDIAKVVKDILDDTFIMEIAREEIDAATLAKIEFSSQIVDKVAKEGDELLLEDALDFLRDVIGKRELGKSRFANTLEKVLTNLNPNQRQESQVSIKAKIEKLDKNASNLNGSALQKQYLEIARLYILLRDWDQALAYIDKVKSVDSTTPIAKQALFYEGLVSKLSGDYIKAQNIFSNIKEELTGELSALSYFEEGDALYRMGRLDEAVSVFEDAFKSNPSSEVNQLSQFRAGYIKIYDLKDVKSFEEAFNKTPAIKIEKISEFGPGEIISFYDLTEEDKMYKSLKNLSKASDDRLTPGIARAYRNRGFSLARQGYGLAKQGKYTQSLGRYVFSEEQFNLAIEIEPQDPLSHSGKSIILYYLKNPEEALKEARLAKKLSPSNSTVLANLGFIYAELRMYDEAVNEYSEAIENSLNSAILYYNIGTIYLLKGDYDKATKNLQKAKLLNPNLASAHNNMGFIHLQQKRYREAKRDFERGLNLEKDYVEARYNLAVLLYNLEIYDQAKKHFQYIKRFRPAYRKTKWFLSSISEVGREEWFD
tara:strand:- start:37 stop:1809 length:1773 start_codon:yes stop_codon:yes gene_type:complete